MTDYDALRKAAEGATPGPWRHDHAGIKVYSIAPLSEHGGIYGHVAAVSSKITAAYIAAASPDVVLALLDEVRDLRDDNAQIRIELDVDRKHALAKEAGAECDVCSHMDLEQMSQMLDCAWDELDETLAKVARAKALAAKWQRMWDDGRADRDDPITRVKQLDQAAADIRTALDGSNDDRGAEG